MNNFASQLLTHYKKNARSLPWRQGVTPYKVWLSEIMLQQTTVVTVTPYFEKFLQHYPTVIDLANANEEEVMHLWQGLGYYSRARNLLKCAKVVAFEMAGQFPQTEVELLKLPGVGPYTAAAIASIAFGEKATVVDGNVERVVSRLFCIETPLPKAKNELKVQAEALTPNADNALYSNAIMELGATICTPKKPKCSTCPVQNHCQAFKQNSAENYPKKEPKKAKHVDHGAVYIIQDQQGLFYLQKRHEKGLLSGLWEFPSTGWKGASQSKPTFLKEAQEQGEVIGQVRHIFTHIDLTLDVVYHQVPHLNKGFRADNLPPLPTLMTKVLKAL